MDLTYIASLTEDQKQVLADLLNHINDEEPFGPGVSSDWVIKMREDLRLSTPKREDLERCRMLQLLNRSEAKVGYTVDDLTTPDGLPVVRIVGSTVELDKLLDTDTE
jgi:hypothetical protein